MSILLQLAILLLVILIAHVLFVQHKGSLKKTLNAVLGKTAAEKHGHGNDPHGHH